MANFDQLKQSVAALIRTNGAEEITGQIMQDVLLTIINSISGGYMFGGVAQHSGNVGNPDYNVFYLAGSGAYTGYGDAITIPNGCYGVFRYNGSWTQEVVDIGVHLTGTIREGETNGVTGDVINTALQQLFNNVMNILDTLTFTYNTPDAQKATKAMLDVIMTPTGGASHVLTTLTLVSATAAAAGLMSAEDKQKLDALWSSGYQFAGIATPSTTPVSTTSKIFYIATEAGTYFNTVTITKGINILSWDGSAWSAVQVIGIDNVPTDGSDNLVKSGGVHANSKKCVCDTAADNPNKEITLDGFVPNESCLIKCWFNLGNTADNVTLNINNTGAKPFYLGRKRAGSDNTWVERQAYIFIIYVSDIDSYVGYYGCSIENKFGDSKAAVPSQYFISDNLSYAYSLINGYIILNDGDRYANADYSYTTPIFMKKDELIIFTATTNHSSLFSCDLSGNNRVKLIQVGDGTGEPVFGEYSYIAPQDMYVLISGATDSLSVFRLKDVISKIYGDFVKVKDEVFYEDIFLDLVKGYVILNNGDRYANADCSYSKPIFLKKDDVLVLTSSTNHSVLFSCDSAGNNRVKLIQVGDGTKNAVTGEFTYTAPQDMYVLITGLTDYLSAKKTFKTSLVNKVDSLDIGFGPVYNKIPTFIQGIFDIVSGEFQKGDKFVTLGYLKNNFAIEVYDEYRIYSVSEFDADGNCVNPIYLAPNDGYSYTWPAYQNRKAFACMNLTSNNVMCITFCRADDGALSPDAPIVKKLEMLDEHLMYDTDVYYSQHPEWKAGKLRGNQLQRCYWESIEKVPAWPHSNSQYYNKGKHHISGPYSATKMDGMYIGHNVSFKTFLSATRNRRSVLYTEDIGRNISAYGFTYGDGFGYAFYGFDCNAFVAWVLNSDIYCTPASYPLNIQATRVQNPTAENLQVLDVIKTTGHVSIITDIIRDKVGNIKYLIWSESVPPYPRMTPYTPAQFAARLSNDNGTVWRPTIPSGSIQYIENPLVEGSDEQFVNNYKGNQYICTYHGDDANFVEGSKIVLNINRDNFTQLEIYKNNTLTNTIDLSQDSEIDLDITTYCNTYGVYKARLKNGNKYSDYTTFNVVQTNVSYTLNGENITIHFSSANAQAYYLEYQFSDGPAPNSRMHILTPTEINNGECTLNWGAPSGMTLKVFFKVDYYGTIEKAIKF